ncbi:MAG TPA: hypothetical protein ENH06_00955 [bacterium]|nr:hypothetical protein [bacterium]
MLDNILINTNGPLSMIPLIVSAGLLDGISPCVIAILIFFIAFLVSLKKPFKQVFTLGLVYIFVVFLTYLSIGVGLFSGFVFFGNHHFFAKLGSWFLILLGLVQIKEAFFSKSFFSFKMPSQISKKSQALLEKATMPTVIGAAFLVGLCSVPCSAGIYTAITSLLASKTTFFIGFLYLLLYNLMVVIPLLVLLFLAANPITLAKLAEWRQKNEKSEKLFMGILMIALGAGILIFFV